MGDVERGAAMSCDGWVGRRAVVTGFLGLMAGVAGATAWAAEPGVSGQEIVVGQSITLQGGKNAYGVEVLAGAQVLIDQVNRAGGVHGRRVVLRTLDDDNKAATAEANARQLIQDGAFVIFGSIEGGPSTAVMKVAEAQQVPFFGPMAGSPTLRRPHQSMVFPVRAEHREEFRALIQYGSKIGLKRVALMHADSEVGLQHLANARLVAAEAGAEMVLALPFKPDVSDEQLDRYVGQLREQRVEMVLNHGSASIYERLVRRARATGLRTTFLAVNSGSTQMVASLGPLAEGMVFSQVVPNPWLRKTGIAREYQDAFAQAHPARAYSYGSLEGYLTAKALVQALQLAGAKPTRAGFVKALEKADLDLGGMKLHYRPGDHAGSTFVDLALVTREGKFLQ
jgi:ABC-type branched-subunit amino acid transport system substrate-binding protein